MILTLEMVLKMSLSLSYTHKHLDITVQFTANAADTYVGLL